MSADTLSTYQSGFSRQAFVDAARVELNRYLERFTQPADREWLQSNFNLMADAPGLYIPRS